MFWKERRRNSRNSWGYFKCGDTTHFIADCPKRKKYDYSNKITTTTRMTSRTTTRRIIALETRRRISRRPCPKRVLS
jgi:hypothetical protein